MTPEQIERLKWFRDGVSGMDGLSGAQIRGDLRALLAEWEEAKRERDAFVAVLDPVDKNVVSAMVIARRVAAKNDPRPTASSEYFEWINREEP